MNHLAPITLFTYNRPWHTRQTLEALAKNELADESVLYIYCDGPKEDASEEQLAKIEEARNLATEKQWCKEVYIVENAENKGLANSVIDGVTEVVNKHGKIIVLEDDLVTSPYFLKYMNEGLDIYKDAENVYSVNAYQYPLEIKEATTLLSPLATSSWGWATWAEQWQAFVTADLPPKELIQQSSWLKERFNFGKYNYTSILDNPKSWAIRWYYFVFLNNGLGLFPTQSLIHNIGFDGSGENCGVQEIASKTSSSPIDIKKEQMIHVEYNCKMYDYMSLQANNTSNQDSKNDKSIIAKILRSVFKL